MAKLFLAPIISYHDSNNLYNYEEAANNINDVHKLWMVYIHIWFLLFLQVCLYV